MANRDFYRAFEDRFRGSREEIQKRLEIYIPFIKPLFEYYNKEIVLDIGCGRGEWIELLQKESINSLGIDNNRDMVAFCQRRNLNTNFADGIAFIQGEPDEKYIAITAFHVVEHIPFEKLQILIQEAYRTLKPGGLLILETPNPENIRVATENFYIDPTHLHPIPSALLAFLPEFHGFSRIKTLKLQGLEHLRKKEMISLQEIFDGVSQDYAVVAQKGGPDALMDALVSQFAKEYGISLAQLASKFEKRLHKIEHMANMAEQRAALAEQRAVAAENNYTRLLQSSSWRITKPLRLLGDLIKQGKKRVERVNFTDAKEKIKTKTYSSLLILKHAIDRKPKIKKSIASLLNHTPKVKSWLKSLQSHSYKDNKSSNYTTSLHNLSPKAQKVYRELKEQIDADKGSH